MQLNLICLTMVHQSLPGCLPHSMIGSSPHPREPRACGECANLLLLPTSRYATGYTACVDFSSNSELSQEKTSRLVYGPGKEKAKGTTLNCLQFSRPAGFVRHPVRIQGCLETSYQICTAPVGRLLFKKGRHPLSAQAAYHVYPGCQLHSR